MICNLLEIIRVFEQWMRSTAFGKKMPDRPCSAFLMH